MTITIETETAGAFPDANEADLQRVVAQLSEDNSYLIVHREDERGYEWAQAALARNQRGFTRGYVVEHKLPTGELSQAKVKTAERVYELLAGWAFDRAEWAAGEKWKPLTEMVIDFIGNCQWDERDGEVHGSFAPLDIAVRAKDRSTAEQVMRDALQMITRDDKAKARAFADWAKDHLVARQ